ncbi:hypothetical protein, partial [uncultured Desulfovibrio sp.]|uniref:hypothetical protein n=1 Tax=uncultured Desulfovibrio sp. TaxID=167968 RepID=UPI002635B9AC
VPAVFLPPARLRPFRPVRSGNRPAHPGKRGPRKAAAKSPDERAASPRPQEALACQHDQSHPAQHDPLSSLS